MTTAGGRITAGVGANLIGQHAQERNQEATCYVGNLDEQVTDELLWELFTQAGPVSAPTTQLLQKIVPQLSSLYDLTAVYWSADNIYVPKDRVTNKHKGHAFVEFKGEEDADYVRIAEPSTLSKCL
jgi:splicing factor 3B subunit 4